jgi:hypothetical protein
VASRLVAIIAGWFAITHFRHFRHFRPDAASNARVTGPQALPLAQSPAPPGQQGSSCFRWQLLRRCGVEPLTAWPAEAWYSSRASRQAVRARAGGSVVVAVPCRVDGRWTGFTTPTGELGREGMGVFSEHCLRQRGETRYRSSTRLVGEMVWRDLHSWWLLMAQGRLMAGAWVWCGEAARRVLYTIRGCEGAEVNKVQ